MKLINYSNVSQYTNKSEESIVNLLVFHSNIKSINLKSFNNATIKDVCIFNNLSIDDIVALMRILGFKQITYKEFDAFVNLKLIFEF